MTLVTDSVLRVYHTKYDMQADMYQKQSTYNSIIILVTGTQCQYNFTIQCSFCDGASVIVDAGLLQGWRDILHKVSVC